MSSIGPLFFWNIQVLSTWKVKLPWKRIFLVRIYEVQRFFSTLYCTAESTFSSLADLILSWTLLTYGSHTDKKLKLNGKTRVLPAAEMFYWCEWQVALCRILCSVYNMASTKSFVPFWHCVAGDTTSHQLPTRIGTSGEHEKSWCDPHSMAKHDATIDNIFAG